MVTYFYFFYALSVMPMRNIPLSSAYCIKAQVSSNLSQSCKITASYEDWKCYVDQWSRINWINGLFMKHLHTLAVMNFVRYYDVYGWFSSHPFCNFLGVYSPASVAFWNIKSRSGREHPLSHCASFSHTPLQTHIHYFMNLI